MRIAFARSKRQWEDWTSWELAPAPGAQPTARTATLWAAFDSEALHLKVRITGPAGCDHGGSPSRDDTLELVLSPQAVDGEVGRFTVLAFSCPAGRPVVILLARNGTALFDSAPEGTAFKVRAEAGEGSVLCEMTVPWSAVPGLHGLFEPAMGLNVTLVTGREADPAVLQLVPDAAHGRADSARRRVARVELDPSGATGNLVKARSSRTFGADEDGTVVEIAVFTGRNGRCEVLTEVIAGSVPDLGTGRRPASRSVAGYAVEAGMNRLRHNFRAAYLGSGLYNLAVKVTLGGGREFASDVPFYKLRTEDVEDLRARYARATGRAPARLHQTLPSVAIRFGWLDALRNGLDPGADPTPLRLLYEELLAMVTEVEAGRNPLARATGYQRRAFRSKTDGSLQPYSVHIPRQARKPEGEAQPATGPRSPLLVMLRGDGVDEVKTARDPALVSELEEHGWLLCAPCRRDPDGWYLAGGSRDIFEAIDSTRATLAVDDGAIFLAGYSRGGFGVWRHGLANPDRLAGLVVLSGFPSAPPGSGPDMNDPARYLDRAAGLPILVVHGAEDLVSPVTAARDFVRRLEEAGAKVVYRELPGAGHGDSRVWGEVFDWLERTRREPGRRSR